jgi:ATP-binding cassette subfamily B protein
MHIKPYKWHYMVMLMAPIMASFYPLLYNYSIKLFLDAMSSSQNITYQDISIPIIIFLSSQISMDLFWRISNVMQWKSEPYVASNILSYSYNYVQTHSFLFFQSNFTGSVSSKIKGILDGYERVWAELHRGILGGVLSIIISLVALSIVNQNVGLLIFIWALVYIPTISFLSKKLNQLSSDVTESSHHVIGTVSDRISNILSLLSFSTRKHEYASLRKDLDTDFIPKEIKLIKQHTLISLVGAILYLIKFSSLLFYMIHLRMENQISIGSFAFVFGITLHVSASIWKTTAQLQDFAKTLGNFKSSMSVLRVPHENLDKKYAKDIAVKSPKIEFKNVNFHYDQYQHIFSDFNLKIKSGEKIGLVGHSGAGKSSLINLLMRYFNATSGNIIIDDQDIANVTQDSMRENIAIIPQDISLFHRTLMDNIRYGKLDATDEEIIEASKKAHIHEHVMNMPEQYNTYVGERGVKLSGGQRQRVAIARAILKDAPILILDEATSALDSQTEKDIQESLDFFIENKKKTVIAIAHRLSTLKHMDRILVLDKGKIVEQGTHTQMLRRKNSLYAKLWKMQEI